MKNILMAGPSLNVHGGISTVVNNLCDAGLTSQINLKYIGTMEEGSKAHKLVVAARAYFQFLLNLSWADAVHINASSDSSFIRKSFFIRAAFRHSKPIVLHQHGGDIINYYNTSTTKRKLMIEDTLNKADRIIVLSPQYRDFFRELTDPSKITILPNAISVPPSPDKIRPHDVLFLGRICRDKGISELLSAMELIHEKIPGATLYLGGIYEDEFYRAEIEKHSDYVKYVGWVNGEQKEELLNRCGIFVLPTYYEGQPVSILEAMAHNCAVVASNVGGIPMMIENNVNGLLIPPKDVNSLTDALMTLLRDTELMGRLGECAHETVLKNFNIEAAVDNLVEIYDELR